MYVFRQTIYSLLLGTCSFLYSILTSNALANPGAWPQAEGKWQVIHNISYYSSDRRFDGFGNRIDQPTFTQRQYNPYIEYGWSEHTTLGANIFVQNAETSGQSNTGLADVEIFARSRIYRERPAWKNSELVLSIQPLIKLPSFADDNDTPALGNDNADIALSLMAGYSFHYFLQKTYAEVEVQYRHRLSDPMDQVRINSTIGQSINPDWQIIAQSFTTLSTDTVRGATFTQSAGDDFDLSTLQLSAVYEYSPQISFQAGGAYDIAGRNTGNGMRALFAVWHRF